FADVMQIKQNSNRAANLVRQLLAFSRQQTMRPKVLVVTDVLSELSNLLRRLIGETIELKMVHGRDVGAVNVDQGQLEQVIINLAVNARDAMPDGGMLTIRTRRVAPDDPCFSTYTVMPSDDYVLIEVADTGTGIAPEHVDKIFEPFFTTKEVGRGTGLGLSTVYGIIKQTGGFIFVESTPGEGSTFKVFLPLHRQPEEEGRAKTEAEVPPRDLTGKETILLVEDEDAVRLFARRALVNKGYHVLEAASGEEALEIARNHDGPIDLLISDVVMPNMDGPTLVHEIRRQSPSTRIVFISGYAEDVFRKRLAHGEQDFAFLPKPFSLKQLAECIKETLEER
ncbi:MAG: response regulator, partial [Alphaproteobacteria bacterium]